MKSGWGYAQVRVRFISVSLTQTAMINGLCFADSIEIGQWMWNAPIIIMHALPTGSLLINGAYWNAPHHPTFHAHATNYHLNGLWRCFVLDLTCCRCKRKCIARIDGPHSRQPFTQSNLLFNFANSEYWIIHCHSPLRNGRRWFIRVGWCTVHCPLWNLLHFIRTKETKLELIVDLPSIRVHANR